MSEKLQIQKKNVLTIVVFVISLIVAGISIISLIFPAMLVTITTGSESGINSFEVGGWTTPFLVINGVLLLFGILFYKKIIPQKIKNGFSFILSFEISRKVTIIAVSIILGVYVVYSLPELKLNEIDVWNDWRFVEPFVLDFPQGEGSSQLKILYVKNFLLHISLSVFQNVKLFPFLASISLVLLTYFFTVKISQKRFAGIIAMLVLLQSHTFLRYDTTATYSNFWTLLYVLSLYLMYKKWYLSPISYLASIFSKPLTVAFLPMSLFFMYRANASRKTKISLVISFLAIIGILAVGNFVVLNSGYERSLKIFNSEEFWNGFTTWAFQLRIDGIVLVFLLPLLVGLFLRSLKGKPELDSILVLITGILFAAPLLAGFSEFNLQPYRWIPLIVFFAIGVGTLFSKNHRSGRNIE